MMFWRVIGVLLVSIILFFAVVGVQLSYHLVQNDGNLIIMWIDGAPYVKPYNP